MRKKTKKPSSKAATLIAAFSALGTTIGVDVESAFAQGSETDEELLGKDDPKDTDTNSALLQSQTAEQYKFMPATQLKKASLGQVKIQPSEQGKIMPASQLKKASLEQVKVLPSVQYKTTPAPQLKKAGAEQIKVQPTEQKKIMPASQLKEPLAGELKIDPGARVR